LLVGKTSAATNVEGGELRENGQVLAVATNVNPFFGARLGSDGDIAVFRKDSTTVGSIGGSVGSYGYMHLGSGATGLQFTNASNQVIPYNPSSLSARDNAIDLGVSSHRFKDLYLSGGAYIGGTGSANHLDDYEEGTWTPTDVAGMNGFSTPNTSHYTKVGRAVFLRGTFSMTGVTTNVQVGGLPFTPFGNTFFSVIHQGFGVTINYANVQAANARVSFNVAATGGGSQNINFTAYYFAS
jgi:hypothetical protein